MLQFGKYKMDTNEIINQLLEENEQLKQLNTAALNVVFRIKDAAIALGCEANDGMAMLDYLIETARATVIVNQENIELVAQREYLVAYAFDAEKWFNKHDPHGYVSPKRAEVQAVLAAHDAEVAAKVIDYKAIQKECSMYFDSSTTYADELATAIFNKLTEKAKAGA